MKPVAKKILFFEYSASHSEFLPSQIRFMQSENYDVHLWINQTSPFELQTDFAHIPVQRFTFSNLFNRLALFFRLKKYLEKNGIEKIIINTAHGVLVREMTLFFRFSKVEIMGVLHFAQNLWESTTQKIISQKIRKYFVLNDYIVQTLSEELPENLKQELQFHVFYYIFFQKNTTQNLPRHDPFFKISILGSVDQSRRDYDTLISEVAKNRQNLQGIKFLLLGNILKNDGVRLKKRIEEEKLDDFFECYEGFVPDQVFFEQVALSDAVMPLFHPHTFKFREFSRYSVSGAFNLAFAYQKPLIMFNAYFPNYPIFKDVSFFYDLENMAEVLANLLENRHLLAQKQAFYSQIAAFDFDYQAKNYVQFVEK